jgi:hypothetical protein
MEFGSKSLASVLSRTIARNWRQKQIPCRTRVSYRWEFWNESIRNRSEGVVASVGEYLNLKRPFDRHIDAKELDALVPSSLEDRGGLHGLSPEGLLEAERHVRSCADCTTKVSKYWKLLHPVSNVAVSKPAPPGAHCPNDEDVDWYEVAAGLWPELRTKQLIMHAALCDHCGPLLRAASSVDNEPTPQEKQLLAQLKAPSRPDFIPSPFWASQPRLRIMKWLVPALAFMLIVGILMTRPRSSPAQFSGPHFAEFAAGTYNQYVRGTLGLDVRLESQQALNEWLKKNSPFAVALPASPAEPGEERPYRLEGARLVQLDGQAAAFIAYGMQTGPVGLMVTPDSVAVASGGVELSFKKVRFHYGMVEGYKVVTWSVHGLTYALASQEGNSTQQSCMVCHSDMRDRDLSHTPTPLTAKRSIVEILSNHLLP